MHTVILIALSWMQTCKSIAQYWAKLVNIWFPTTMTILPVKTT